jgi:hypothetical protein
MEKGVINGQMEIYMRAYGKTISFMAKECIFLKMGGNMRESGLRERCTEKDIIFGQMDSSIKDSII